MEEAVKLLKKYNQEKVLKELEKNKNPELIEQILNIDFEKIEECKQKIGKEEQFENDKIENISYIDGNKLTKEERDYYENIGKDIISKGKYAVVTMAGGQGTRLGHIGPKGTFKIDVKPNPKYLFEILIETLKKANEKYNVTIPWYIMVSRENKEETIAFLEEKNYFNYPKEMIKFFVQGEMPLIGEDGQFLLNKEGSLMLASDGNGSIYYSMKKNGILEDMKQKQIEWVYICSVDNVLLQMVEPILLGLTIKQKNEIASKTIVKNGPEERVGVFCKKNGKPSVIEYTELPKDMAELRDEEGELIFGEAHIMCNLFSINAIEKIAEKTLPYHIAFKKINHYIDGKLVEPEEPNSYKFEQFIFDSFPFFENITLLRGKREEDFAPVKNKEGNDSPKTAAELYNNYWKNF